MDLSGNRLADISIGDALSSCPKLKTLNLSRNPINGVINYQLIMAALIPNIEVLDNNPVDPLAQSKVSNGMILEAASLLRVMEEELNDERRLEEELGIATKVFSSKSDSISRDSGKESSGSATIKTNGIFPDTGSELTHGSSVVLAGSMAAAMRKRREQLSSPNSRKLAPLHHMEEKESESTLDILDIARQWKSPGKQHATDDYSMFLKEGDITAAMTGKRSVSANFKGSKKGKDPFVINFDEIELPQSSSPLTSARSKNSARYKGMNDDSLEGPSSTRRPKSAVSDVSFDDRNYLSNSSSLHIQDVPLDMSRKKSVNSSFNSVEASPRQRNSSRGGSRPQSAISTAANFSSSTMSVPFKVSIDSNAANSEDVNIKNKNLKSGVQITPRGLSNYNSISVSSNLSGNSVDFEVEDEDADDMSWFQARGDIKKKAVNLNVTISDGNNDSSSKAVPASIVHRDIVRRTMFSNDGVDCSNEVDIIDDVDDEGESDVEDIAVNHVSRFRLMSASGNRSKPNNDKANKPWAGLSDQTKTANDEDSLTTDLLSPGIVKKPPIHRGNSKGLSNSSSKTTLSSMVSKILTNTIIIDHTNCMQNRLVYLLVLI